MTVEEALVALIGLGAFVMLFIGLAQALDSPPHPRRRRRAGAFAASRGTRREPPPLVVPHAPVAAPSTTPAVPVAEAPPESSLPPVDASPGEVVALPEQPQAMAEPAAPVAAEGTADAQRTPEPLPVPMAAEAPAEPEAAPELFPAEPVAPVEPAAQDASAETEMRVETPAEEERAEHPEPPPPVSAVPAASETAVEEARASEAPPSGEPSSGPAPPRWPRASGERARRPRAAPSTPRPSLDETPATGPAEETRDGEPDGESSAPRRRARLKGLQAEIAAAIARSPGATGEPALSAPAPVERGLALLGEGEYARALEETEPVLRRHPGPALAGPAAHQRTLLWVVAGLARRALGDGAGARAAWDSALRFLPRPQDVADETRVAGAASALARRLLDAAAPGPEGDRPVPELRLASGLAAIALRGRPDDTAARDLAELTGAALASAFAARAQGLLHRREFAAAHRLLAEALAEPDVAPAGRAELADLYWTSLTGEVGRLTGLALGGGIGDDPMEPLERAERLVGSVPAGVLTEERARDLTRRLWWAYTRLGLARREAGDLDGALVALFDARRVGAADAEREAEARRILVETVQVLVDRWTEGIGRMVSAGDRDGAAGELEQLTDAIDRALSRGLTADDLAGALARRRELASQLAGDTAP